MHTPYSIMDACSYCEVATDSIQKSLESGDFDSAAIRLCAYLLEIHNRYLTGEIDAATWRETLRFYRRMTATINDELNIQQSIQGEQNMKLYCETKITVVGKAEPTHSQDGKSTYYRVAVMQNGQATNLPVSEEIYHSIPAGLVEVVLSTVYDDTYKSFKADRLLQIVSVNGQPYSKAVSTSAPEKTAK